MNSPVAEPPAPAPSDAGSVGNRYRRRVRFELIFASIWLAVGLFAVPATIFAVGGALLGPYGDNGGLGRFYGDFFGDLAEPSVRAWAIALSPLVLVSLLRLVFAGAGRGPTELPASPDRPVASRRAAEEARRVEPSVTD
jgi:hypothetical protein